MGFCIKYQPGGATAAGAYFKLACTQLERRWRENTAVRFEAKLGGNPIYKTPSIIAAHDMVAYVLHPAALPGQGADKARNGNLTIGNRTGCGKGPNMKPQDSVYQLGKTGLAEKKMQWIIPLRQRWWFLKEVTRRAFTRLE